MLKKYLFIYLLFPFGIFAEPVLNLYIGSNYIANGTIDRFEKLCNCRLSQNYFNDNEEMLAKIVAGARGYDVIVATGYAIEELGKMGKIKPLDLKQLPNLKYIDPKFLNQGFDPKNKYSVPYAYTPVFLSYNQEKIRQLGITPNTWAVIFEPKYLEKLKGRITVFNSARHVFAAALLYLGKDPSSTKINDLLAAKKLIEKAAPYWAKYDSDSYYRALLRGDIWLSMSYSIDIFKATIDANNAHSKVVIDAMLQKEGNMYELDNMVIPIFNKNDKMAYQFINNALDPQSAFELSVATGSSVPNLVAFKKLSPSITNIEWIYPKDSKKMHTLISYDPKSRILINEMWTEIQMQCHF